MGDDDSGHGQHAEKPREIPSRGWLDIAKRVKNQLADDHVQIVAAGVAFYFFFALFPAITAVISVYGLLVDPSQAEAQIDGMSAMLPEQAHGMIGDIAHNIASSSNQTLGWGMALAILLSLWSANKGTTALFEGLNIAYDEADRRNFFRKNMITLVCTLLGIITGIIMMALIAGFPALVVGRLGLPEIARTLINYLRWPLMALIVIIFLGVLYKIAPDREGPEWRWVTWGSVIATMLWLAGSFLFSWYVDNFGKFGNTYGSFAAIIILMLWFWLTAFIVLLGAEINSEMEHQTGVDTTTGPDEPMGQRGAYHADHVAGEPHEGS